MPLQCIQQFSNSSVCCCKLVQTLDLDSDSMQPCRECVLWDLTCCVDKKSDKCLECVWLTCCKCDLVVTAAEWAWVDQKVTHLWAELQETMARIDHLCKQYDLIQLCKSDMIWRKFQNIKELKTDDVKWASRVSLMSSLNDFLLNVSSDWIDLSVNFNSLLWSEHGPVAEDTSQWSLNTHSDCVLVSRCFSNWSNSFT